MPRIFAPIVLACLCLIAAPDADARPKKSRVRAMTFNVRYDFRNDGGNRWANRVDAVAQRIKEGKAQIVCLQEDKAHQIDDLKSRLSDYHFVGRGRNATGSGERCSILFLKKTFKLKANGDFWLSDTPDVPGSNTWRDKYPRKVTWAHLVSRKTRKSILILNTHLPEGKFNPLREKGTKVMYTWLKQRFCKGESKKKSKRSKRMKKTPKCGILIAGDFNTDAGTKPHDILTEAPELRLQDAWEVARPRDPHPGTYAGWRGLKTRQRIDWLLVGGRIRVLRAGKFDTQVLGRWPSDHYAVFADIELR